MLKRILMTSLTNEIHRESTRRTARLKYHEATIFGGENVSENMLNIRNEEELILKDELKAQKRQRIVLRLSLRIKLIEMLG